MKKQSLFLVLTLVMVLLSGCKIPKEFLSDLKVTPSPLEMHAGKVKVTVEGTFPAKYFHKKMVLTVTPVLRSKTTGMIIKGTPKVYQGEKVKGNNPTISFKNGGKYTQSAEFDYVPEMESAELWFEAVAVVKEKEYIIEAIKAADGIIVTPLLVATEQGELNAQIDADKFQRIVEEKQEAEIMFLIQQSNIRSAELKTQPMVDLTKRIKEAKEAENMNLKNLEISSYASPDGGLELNEKLASAREKESEKYINKELKKLKTTVSIDGKFTAQDWEGFKALMEKSSIQDKEVILRVLSMHSDPEKREAEIKNLAAAYKDIAETILPQLRRSKMTLAIEVIGKSDEQLVQLATTDPSKLNVEELLYAATLSNDLNYKAGVYQIVVDNYSNDIRGYNNLGVVRYEQRKLDEADRLFTKALSIDQKSMVANYNKAVIALAKNDIANAEIYLGNAGGVGNDLNLANGVLAIKKGDYAKAVKDFGTTNSNNAALAKILNKDYSGARKVLENIQTPNATTAYLFAIIGARTNDTNMVLNNLAKAIKMDSSYKAKALKDAEFLSFADNTAFIALFN